MRLHCLGLAAALHALPGSVAAQNGHDLLQRALVLETVRGDLAGAVALYQRIVRESPADRPLQARALAQLAHGYELLGRPEARQVYQRLMQDFPQQVAFAGLAQARLTALDAGRTRDPTHVLLLDQAQDDGSWRAGQFDFSPDGSGYVFRVVPDSGNPAGVFRSDGPALYIGHRDGRLPRVLVTAAQLGGMSPRFPRWSLDGRLIAFLAREGPSEGARWILFVVPAAGGAPRQVGAPLDGQVWDLQWTRDGRVAWSARRQIRYRQLDGTTSDVAGDPGPRAILGGFSPNGRWLALARTQVPGATLDQDVWVMATSTGSFVRVTERSGLDGFPAWGNDSTLFFVSTRDGARNVWRVAIEPGTGRATRDPRQVTFYQDANVGHLRAAGRDRIGFTLLRSTKAVFVADASNTANPAPVVRGGQPLLSPDGSTVYYVVPKVPGEPDGSLALHALDRGTGAVRQLAEDVLLESGAGVPGYDLSPDGRTLVFPAADGTSRELRAVSTSGGTPVRLATLQSGGVPVPRFSPDGSRVGYADSTVVYAVSPAGGTPRRLADLAGGFEGWSLRWSPDGRQIAIFGYPANSPGGNNAVYLIPADENGGTARQISEAQSYKEGLAWSPNGERLTYHLSLQNSRTVQVPTAGGPEGTFHDEPRAWDYRGIWGPDGRTFYFEATPEAEPAWRVYGLDTQTGRSRVLAGNNASLPVWSRDGRTVAWTEAPRIANQLWLVENLPE